jgi:hypothetical protein
VFENKFICSKLIKLLQSKNKKNVNHVNGVNGCKSYLTCQSKGPIFRQIFVAQLCNNFATIHIIFRVIPKSIFKYRLNIHLLKEIIKIIIIVILFNAFHMLSYDINIYINIIMILSHILRIA